MPTTIADRLRNLSGTVVALGIIGVFAVSWAGKAGYDYLDEHWLSLRCSVLREQYAKAQLEYAERKRLEDAGLIQPTTGRMPTSLYSHLPPPTYEEYKEQQKQMAEMSEYSHRWAQRQKECGIGIFAAESS